MPTPYDEFGRDYPSATPTPPSPAVNWVETNTLGLDFVLPVGEPEAYEQAWKNHPDGNFLLWLWKSSWTPGLPGSVLPYNTPPSAVPISVTISGDGGSFTANLTCPWNNENSWNTLQIFQRTALGGIDLDWMAVGCNAVLLPFPEGLLPYTDLFLGYKPNFYFAVGFKIMTPRGSSQFFYPGSHTLNLVTPTGTESYDEIPTAPGAWVSATGTGVPPRATAYYSAPSPIPAPIIPVTEEHLSPTVQLPVFGGSQQVYYEGITLPGFAQVSFGLVASASVEGDSITFDAWTPLQPYGVYYGVNAYWDMGTIQGDYNILPSYEFPVVSVYNGVLALYCTPWEVYGPAALAPWGGASLITVYPLLNSTVIPYALTESVPLGTETAFGSYNIPVPCTTIITGIELSETLAAQAGSAPPPPNTPYPTLSWPNLYNLTVTINMRASTETVGPYLYVWGGFPGGAGVFAPSALTNGQVGSPLWVFSNYSSEALDVAPTYTYGGGTYTYPIMQVPVGPDTFLVSF